MDSSIRRILFDNQWTVAKNLRVTSSNGVKFYTRLVGTFFTSLDEISFDKKPRSFIKFHQFAIGFTLFLAIVQ